MKKTDEKISLAISTCPNDTFAFHGLIHQLVDWRGLDFSIEYLDIQQLNNGLFQGRFDVAKASFHAAVLLADSTIVLSTGAALGFGVGPLLLASREGTNPANTAGTTLCPGKHTTATLLFQMFYGSQQNIQHIVFSEIMPKLQIASADFGVCIHEGRFTWEEQGLYLIEDLGTRWESETNCPLPLGGILARRTLGTDTVLRVQRVIQDSIQFGLDNREQTLPTMRHHAQEFEDEVLFQHVDLYVNDWTIRLGSVGTRALELFGAKANQLLGHQVNSKLTIA